MNFKPFINGHVWQKLPGNEHVKRALEIAIAGNHKILIICHTELDNCFEAIFKELSLKILNTASPCPCGGYNHPSNECVCDPLDIKKHQTELNIRMYDIVIEATLPKMRDYTSLGEDWETVSKRITGIKHFDNYEIKEDGIRLLEMAISKMGIDIVKAVKVGRTIADLDGYKSIEIHHISEAIQYQTYKAF